MAREKRIAQQRIAPLDLGLSNQRLLEKNLQRRENFHLNPQSIYWWWQPCSVRVLLVTDGGLDFGEGDFGLSTFVDILQNDAPSRVRFDLTLAHLRSDVLDTQVMRGAPGIVDSITDFRFDNPAHFTPDMYDEVWLFGIETFFHQPSYDHRFNHSDTYPADRLSDEELRNLSTFMNKGGGAFATGDHGALGRALCGSITRVRSMRHWDSFPSGNPGVDQVSMAGPRRNDTNHVGHDAGTQFSDQSDDIPQPLDLVLYSTPGHALQSARYPHPVLCGRNGRIDVLPDHPHEGECRTPQDVTLTYEFDKTLEYPLEIGGASPVVPEVIAYSHVPAGNTADKAGSKQATIAHTFGAISAYNGHRAGVGQVVCDATWHHFVNVNLIGVVEGGFFDQFDNIGGDRHIGEHLSKHDGFLSSAQGLAALEKIKNYYTNIGVWIAPLSCQRCFNRKPWWELIYADRIMEAALVDPNIPFEKIPTEVFYAIGVHARDAFGRRAGQCQTLAWVIDWLTNLMPEYVPWINPWGPVIRPEREESPPLPVFDPQPMIDVALGAALVAMRQAFPYPSEKLREDQDLDQLAEEIRLKGARQGLDMAIRQVNAQLEVFGRLLNIG
ncbi:MAG TPA: hypothetical protein VGD69_04920 [Herpetosiphonaceae bacterium]